NPLAPYFTPADEHLKLYRRRGERVLPSIPSISAVSPRELTGMRTGQRHLADWSEPAAASAERVRRELRQARTVQPAPSDPLHTPHVHERLGSIVLEARVGAVVVDRQYDIQIVNAEAIRLLGIYAPTIGNDLLHVAQGILITALRTVLDAAFRSPEASPHEGSTTTITQTVHGEQRYIQIACYLYIPKRDRSDSAADGEPESRPDLVLLLVSDVTDLVRRQEAEMAESARAQANEMLARAHGQEDSEQRFQNQIAENARLKAQVEEVSTLNHTLLTANQQLVEANAELRNTNQELLVGREEAEASAEEIKTLNEEMQASNEELVTVNEELEATVEELHTANEDLTARSRELQRLATLLEQQHQASAAERDQLNAILLSMGDALMVVDAAGVVTLTNPAYARVFGRADAEVLANDMAGVPLPPDQQPQRRAMAGAPFQMQFTSTTAGGALQALEATGWPIGNGGTTQGSVITIRDITTRRQRLLQEEFLALASHELRSPLSSLVMALNMLAKRAATQTDDPEFQAMMRIARRQGQRLRVLVNDLLDVNRMQQGRLHLTLAPVDLVALVEETIEAVQLDTQGQQIIFDHEPEPLVVMADSVRLEQIVVNLLNNAIKYAPGTPQIDVRLRRVEGADGAEAQLEVQDYGPGISAADLPQIFTRYFQSAQTASAGTDGLGLGLFITNELVTAHEGSITVTSVVGQGTTFTVRLPLPVAQDHAPNAGEPVNVPKQSGRAGAQSRHKREQ
ncbi:MAG: ATP-binding protein, partial [Ktedonobacterales bacterium]